MTPHLPDIVCAWLAGLLAVCSFLHCWFKTALPCELLLLLKQFGWRKGSGFWPSEGEEPQEEHTMTRSDWDMWLNMCVVDGSLPRRLVHVALCPGCLSVHASYVVAVLVLLVWSPDASLRFMLGFVIAGPCTWVWASNRLSA